MDFVMGVFLLWSLIFLEFPHLLASIIGILCLPSSVVTYIQVFVFVRLNLTLFH